MNNQLNIHLDRTNVDLYVKNVLICTYLIHNLENYCHYNFKCTYLMDKPQF